MIKTSLARLMSILLAASLLVGLAPSYAATAVGSAEKQDSSQHNDSEKTSKAQKDKAKKDEGATPDDPADGDGSSTGLDCYLQPGACVDQVDAEMTRRFDPLASSCDHDAVFALLYLRTTEEVRRAVAGETPSVTFAEPGYIAVEDQVFARYYFTAYDNWHSGRTSVVPRAWQIALQAADDQKVTGSGNILLGANAHINRDLAFVLEEMGLVNAAGQSAKPDHDKINDVLRIIAGPVTAEIAARFDPTVDDATIDNTTADTDALVALFASWREAAWRNAELLVAAETPQQRQKVVDSIEAEAAAIAKKLLLQNSYKPPLNGPDERNAWCASHGTP